MCNPGNYSKDHRTPAQKLADLMKAELDVSVSSTRLRIFIEENWRQVTAYAHAIHDAGSQTTEFEAAIRGQSK